MRLGSMRHWRTQRLAAQADRPADNFLLLRHIAALLVIYGHSYDLSLPYSDADLIATLWPNHKAGGFAVYLFFAISGFLLTSSLIRTPSVGRYLRHRFTRIFPAYWLSLLFCIALIGPLFSHLDALDYARQPAILDYILDNAIPIGFTWALPGVFADNPYPNVVNGSLWSLGLELRLYTYLGLLLMLGLVTRRWAFSLIALLWLAHACWLDWQQVADQHYSRFLTSVFLIAGLAAHWRSRLPINFSILAGLLLIYLLALNTPFAPTMLALNVVCGVLCFAYRLPAIRFPRDLDLSYGLFLYGFPVQQALIHLIPTISPMALFALATLICGLLAWLSWRWVERPLQSWTRKRDRNRTAASLEPREVSQPTGPAQAL